MPRIKLICDGTYEGRPYAAGEELDVSEDCALLAYRSGQAIPAPPKNIIPKQDKPQKTALQ